MDGDKAYFFGGGTRGGWSQSNKLQVLSIVPETATCAADNWHTQRSDTTTCGTSLIAGQCHASATFGDAKRTCIAAGGRLCTAAELWHGVARGTGCGLDGESVWTASPCPGADGTRDPSRKQMMQGSGAASFSEVLEEGGPGCCRSATASQGGHYEAVRLATIHDCEQRCAGNHDCFGYEYHEWDGLCEIHMSPTAFHHASPYSFDGADCRCFEKSFASGDGLPSCVSRHTPAGVRCCADRWEGGRTTCNTVVSNGEEARTTSTSTTTTTNFDFTSLSPTSEPTTVPTGFPSRAPSQMPTDAPTRLPTDRPTSRPTNVPTSEPSRGPSSAPTPAPTVAPTSAPTVIPTSSLPTAVPSVTSTSIPSNLPTTSPSLSPSSEPSAAPTTLPTINPSTALPTPAPTAVPTVSPVSLFELVHDTDCWVANGYAPIEVKADCERAAADIGIVTPGRTIVNGGRSRRSRPAWCYLDRKSSSLHFNPAGENGRGNDGRIPICMNLGRAATALAQVPAPPATTGTPATQTAQVTFRLNHCEILGWSALFPGSPICEGSAVRGTCYRGLGHRAAGNICRAVGATLCDFSALGLNLTTLSSDCDFGTNGDAVWTSSSCGDDGRGILTVVGSRGYCADAIEDWASVRCCTDTSFMADIPAQFLSILAPGFVPVQPTTASVAPTTTSFLEHTRCRDSPCSNAGTCVPQFVEAGDADGSGSGSGDDPDAGDNTAEYVEIGFRCLCQGSFLGRQCGESGSPTSLPTHAPSSSAPTTAGPTTAPSQLPSARPTAGPSAIPTAAPSRAPTAAPSRAPTAGPSAAPSEVPTVGPSAEPSARPTPMPTDLPSSEPTAVPSTFPSSGPSLVPTPSPTKHPTCVPTAAPSRAPSPHPSGAPTAAPLVTPTEIVITYSYAPVRPNSDCGGGDRGNFRPSTLPECHDYCSEDRACTGVSFKGDHCITKTLDVVGCQPLQSVWIFWAKHRIVDVILLAPTAASNAAGLDPERRSTPGQSHAVLLPAPTEQVITYAYDAVQPDTDCGGGDLDSHQPTTQRRCFNYCSEDPVCTGVSFKLNHCITKSIVVNDCVPVPSTWLFSAKTRQVQIIEVDVVAPAVPLDMPPLEHVGSDRVADDIAAATTVGARIMFAAVQSGADCGGGDRSSFKPSSLDACFDQCTDDPHCTGVSFSINHCITKEVDVSACNPRPSQWAFHAKILVYPPTPSPSTGPTPMPTQAPSTRPTTTPMSAPTDMHTVEATSHHVNIECKHVSLLDAGSEGSVTQPTSTGQNLPAEPVTTLASQSPEPTSAEPATTRAGTSATTRSTFDHHEQTVETTPPQPTPLPSSASSPPPSAEPSTAPTALPVAVPSAAPLVTPTEIVVTFTFAPVLANSDCGGGDQGSFQPATLEECHAHCTDDDTCTGVSFRRDHCIIKALEVDGCRPRQSEWVFWSKIRSVEVIFLNNGPVIGTAPAEPTIEYMPIQPGTDCGGGDRADIQPASLEECFAFCTADAGCTGVSFRVDHCIAKDVVVTECTPRLSQWVFHAQTLVYPPTAIPTPTPTAMPTGVPFAAPTAAPTPAPSTAPTSRPTAQPSPTPTQAPSATPTTAVPTDPISTLAPAPKPTLGPGSSFPPTPQPTTIPSVHPTSQPTPRPFLLPSAAPSKRPTFVPTGPPSPVATMAPSSNPTDRPSTSPTAPAPPTMPSYSLLQPGADCGGGDLGSSPSTDLEQCFELCTETPGCTGVSFLDRHCITKSVVVANCRPRPAAWQFYAQSGWEPVTTEQPVIHDVQPQTTNISYAPLGEGVDCVGGDLDTVWPIGLEACMDRCTADAALCTGVTFRGTFCILKSVHVLACEPTSSGWTFYAKAGQPGTPAIPEWNYVAPMAETLRESQGLAAGGKLWVFGGFFGGGWVAMGRATYAYDPVADRWDPHTPIPIEGGITHCGQATSAVRKTIYLVGG